MDRRRPIGLPRTRSTFANEFFQPDHPPLRRDPFDKFQTSVPSFNRFRVGTSDPNSRIFTDDDDQMFFDNFPRRTFYDEPEFFHASMPPNEEPYFFQTQPKEPVPPLSHHQRSKSHYDNVSDQWANPNRRPFHVKSDGPFDGHFNQHQNVQRQPPNDPNVHVIKIHHEGRQPGSAGRESVTPNNGRKFVEINNSVPNYELLNPDKRRRRSNSHQEDSEGNNVIEPKIGEQRRAPSVPSITIEDFSFTNNNDNDEITNATPIPLPAPAIPLPAPEGMAMNIVQKLEQNQDIEPKKSTAKGQSTRNIVTIGDDERCEIDEYKRQQKDEKCTQQHKQIDETAKKLDDLVQLLDETEHLTEQFRENAMKLEQEKETILDKINSIKSYDGSNKLTMPRFSQAERDGIMLNLQRILARCNSVNISIETPRDQNQLKALEQVNRMIHSTLDNANGNVAESKQKISGFLNACNPDEVGNIDEKFQSAIIECTADDQKKIRRKLVQIAEQMTNHSNK